MEMDDRRNGDGPADNDGAVATAVHANGAVPAVTPLQGVRALPRRLLTVVGVRSHAPAALLPNEPVTVPDEPQHEPEHEGYAAVAIDRGDDLASVFGKIDAADSPRIALVAPRGNRELSRQLGMRRLQRHLDLTGKDLILVTRSRGLRVRAREEGVPSATSLKRIDFDQPDRGLQLGWLTLRLPSIGALISLALFVAAVALGAIVLFWYVPTATVTVYVPTETIGDTVDLLLDAKAGEVNAEKGIVPAHRRELVVKRSIPGRATGVAVKGLEHAGVGITFTNRTARAVTIPKGTNVIATNGMPFTIANDVQLVARVGATAEVIALAQRPGSQGNIPPGTATRMESPFAEQVSATNPKPGEKGTDLQQTVVSEADVELARQVAAAYLGDVAKKELLAQFAQSETVFADGQRVELLDSQPVPPVGQVARYTEVNVTGRTSTLTARDVDLHRVYIARFLPKIGPDRMLMEDSFRALVEAPGAWDETFDRLAVSPRISASVAPRVDKAELREELTGKTRSAVERIVRDRVGLTMPPTVRLPRWAPFLPKRANRITVEIKPEAQP